MKKLFYIKEGKWYLGIEINQYEQNTESWIKSYRIWGEGKLHSSEVIIPKENVYSKYRGIFDKELFITKSKWRDNRLNILLEEV